MQDHADNRNFPKTPLQLRYEDFVRVAAVILIGALLMLTAACGGGSGSDIQQSDVLPTDLPPPPRIAGVWSGTWEGIDSTFGPAAGTWVARISQQETDVDGPMEFGGDIDCAEGNMVGLADAASQQVSGQVFRDPCPFNDWHFTAFDQDQFIASGSWEKRGLSNGSFEGKRIATFTGPEISHIYPPAADAGALVTLVGKRLTLTPGVDVLKLGETGTPIVPIEASDSMIRFRLPLNPGHSDQFIMTVAGEAAVSPRVFETRVGHPKTNFRQKIALAAVSGKPAGIAASINGRRVFVVNRLAGTVSMINTEMGQEWISTVVFPGPSPAVPVHAIAVDPDGRSIYVAGENMLGVVHAHTLAAVRAIPVPSKSSGDIDQNGIAISPDGRWLLVSEAVAGGRVTILDLDNNFTVADTLQMASGNIPRGITVHPDNTRAYIAVSGGNNEVQVYNLATQNLESPLALGDSPIAMAVTPDGGRLVVISDTTARIDSYDLINNTSESTSWAGGEQFRSIAISPDGLRAYVTSNFRVLNFNLASGVNSASVIDFSAAGGGSESPVGVTFVPDGKRAYISLLSTNEVAEIGNQRTLRISKQGGGIGEVFSTNGEINCGATCISSFDAGSQVWLSTRVASSSNSSFHRWDGDADCADGRVTMNANVFCVAVFRVNPPPSSGGGSGGGSTGTSGSSSCFIATAAYGSWLDPHVLTLRQFRDDYLLTNTVGTWLVGYYYRFSPPIAAYIRKRESLRFLVRLLLVPIVYSIEYPVAALLMLLLPALLRLRRRRRLHQLATG